jgi:hypothetical protein
MSATAPPHRDELARVARPGVRTQRRPNVRSSPGGLIAGTTVWFKSEIRARWPCRGGRCAGWRRAQGRPAGGRMMTHGDARMRRGGASMAQKCVGASHQPDAVRAPPPDPSPLARFAGCCRHRFPRSHGPAEHKVKTQWLTLRCPANPSRAAPDGSIPALVQRARSNNQRNPRAAGIQANAQS